jgi:polyribonucleotide nucleotidyltransferase
VFEDLQYTAYRATVLAKGRPLRPPRRESPFAPCKPQVGVLPRVHGSAMFQRGDTQNIAIVTLGPTKEAQEMDGLTGGPTSKSFILHYNFPSVLRR